MVPAMITSPITSNTYHDKQTLRKVGLKAVKHPFERETQILTWNLRRKLQQRTESQQLDLNQSAAPGLGKVFTDWQFSNLNYYR